MRAPAQLAAGALCFVLGIAAVALPSPSRAAADVAPAAVGGGAGVGDGGAVGAGAAGPTPAPPRRVTRPGDASPVVPAAPTRRRAAPAPPAGGLAADAPPAIAADAELDDARVAFAAELRPQMQAGAAATLWRFADDFDLDDGQVEDLTALVHAEIDGIIDLQLDGADGVPFEERADELSAMFDATDAQAAEILDDEELQVFMALRRRD